MDFDSYKNCTLCPRKCRVDRNIKTGYYKTGSALSLSRAALHLWEEPCLEGKNGSGAVFFGGCSLGCVFCQNREISRGMHSKEVDRDRLCEIFFELRDKGACNINLVTPDHFAPHIVYAIEKAKKQGFDLPFVWNSSGYSSPETIRALSGLIDIYLPDFKYFSNEYAKKYSNVPDYFDTAQKSLYEMHRQIPFCEFDENGIMKRGIIVRLLLLPQLCNDAKKILYYLHETYGNRIYISIMSQYTPINCADLPKELRSSVPPKDYDELCRYAEKIGIENGFLQDGESIGESFIPDFDFYGV